MGGISLVRNESKVLKKKSASRFPVTVSRGIGVFMVGGLRGNYMTKLKMI